ncbi:MAG: glycoside hydrolase family 99-like domain-containing protein [Deltaproteobacteria bacterium]|nr:glycoside hydrolase family 99-like domain-containing protein [Deltaproteobacteria bacterium]
MNPPARPAVAGRRHWAWTAAGIAVAVVLLGSAYYLKKRPSGTPPAKLPVIQSDRYLVGAHYYHWYPRNFRHGYLREHLRPRQTFPGGEYQSTDIEVIARHIAWCSEYGIDFLSIGWWSHEPERTESFLDHLYRTPNIADIKFCVFYETQSLGFDPKLGTTSFDEAKTARMIADFEKIAARCFSHPSYLRLRGRPVVFLYLSRTFSGAFAPAVARLRSAMRTRGYDLFLIGDEIFWRVSPVVPSGRIPFPLVKTPQPARFCLFDAITSYNMYESGAASQKGYAAQSTYVSDVAAKYAEYISAAAGRVYFVPQIIPGYNDRGVRRRENHYAIPREWSEGSGEASLFASLFDRTALRFLDPRLNMILITSFNEWNEDTAIEPLEPSGPTRTDDSASGNEYTQGYSYSGHGLRYLETLRNKVLALCGTVRRGSGAVPGAVVRAYKGQQLMAETRTDSAGRFRFSRLALPADQYTIRAADQPDSAYPVTVRPGTCSTGIHLKR